VQKPSCFPSASSSAMPRRRVEPFRIRIDEAGPHCGRGDHGWHAGWQSRFLDRPSSIPLGCPRTDRPVAKGNPAESQGAAYLGDSGCTPHAVSMLASDILRLSDARRFGPPFGAAQTYRARILARYRRNPARPPSLPSLGVSLTPPHSSYGHLQLAGRQVGRLVGTRPLQPSPSAPALSARRNAAAWRRTEERPRGSC
jgi:hypothetical protein